VTVSAETLADAQTRRIRARKTPLFVFISVHQPFDVMWMESWTARSGHKSKWLRRKANGALS
jgi:hypothetical protein